MLVLSRKADESIVLTCPDGTRITFLVCRIMGPQVKIGIDAPRSVVIERDDCVKRPVDKAVRS